MDTTTGQPDTGTPSDDGRTASPDAIEGEGNYTAARRHRESVEDFVKSGRVDEAAREAAPSGPQEAESLRQAEERGRSHAKD